MDEKDHKELLEGMYRKLDALIKAGVIHPLQTPVFCMGYSMALLDVEKEALRKG